MEDKKAAGLVTAETEQPLPGEQIALAGADPATGSRSKVGSVTLLTLSQRVEEAAGAIAAKLSVTAKREILAMGSNWCRSMHLGWATSHAGHRFRDLNRQHALIEKEFSSGCYRYRLTGLGLAVAAALRARSSQGNG